MSAPTLLAGALVVVGLVGVVVPALPGVVLVAAGVLVWALEQRSAVGWLVLAGALVVLAAGQVLKWLLAGRTLVTSGVPRWSLVVAGLAGLVGFFVVPVVGLPLGFVAGLYLCELARLGPGRESARSTWVALRAVGVAVLVELGSALLAAVGWAAAAVWQA